MTEEDLRKLIEDKPDFEPPYSINYTAKEQYVEAMKLLDELGIEYTADDPEMPKKGHGILIHWKSKLNWVELEIPEILPILSKFDMLGFDAESGENWALWTTITTKI